jgi:hypothetical protein
VQQRRSSGHSPRRVCLWAQVAQGKASKDALKREEAQLAALQQRLQGVQGDLQGMLSQGANLFRSIGLSKTVQVRAWGMPHTPCRPREAVIGLPLRLRSWQRLA